VGCNERKGTEHACKAGFLDCRQLLLDTSSGDQSVRAPYARSPASPFTNSDEYRETRLEVTGGPLSAAGVGDGWWTIKFTR
jgi:hypothetical protein